MKKICVYCASSDLVDFSYKEAASELGKILAKNGYEVIYGGGSIGLMGALADAVLAENGKITGVIPKFMMEREWGHRGVNLIEVKDMHERKKMMLESSDCVIALAGGCGTFEEILEAITWRRLGLYTGPAFILNSHGFYNHLVAQLELAITEKFMSEEHRHLWQVVLSPEEFLFNLKNIPKHS